MEITAQGLRTEAARLEAQAHESFDRCDTDGCVSQWCDSWSARKQRTQAEIVEAGGVAIFSGLYQGARRVAAKEIRTQFGWCWLLRDDEARRFGRRFVPCARVRQSRVQTKLGLCQRDERGAEVTELVLIDRDGNTARVPLTMRPAKCKVAA